VTGSPVQTQAVAHPLISVLAAGISEGLRYLSSSVAVEKFDEVEAEWEQASSAGIGRRLILYHFMEDAVPRLIVDRVMRAEGRDPLLPGVKFVCSDSLTGRMAAGVLASGGRASARLRTGATGAAASDLVQLLREGSAICMAADGADRAGMPAAGQINARFWRFVVASRGLAIPIAAVVSRAIRLRWPARLVIPVPGCRMAVAVGSPVDGSYVQGDELASQLRDALIAARSTATRRLGR
jgi:lysophospholipid acyltransferase (LPLAT)-like uncharacterized protein